MKRQKKFLSLLSLLLCFCLLTGCRPETSPETPSAPEDPTPPGPQEELLEEPPEEVPEEIPEAPAASPLPSSGDIDWNDIPSVWTGSGGSKVSAWLDSRVHTAVSYLPGEDTYENTSEGIFSYSITYPSFTGLRDTELQQKIIKWAEDATRQLEEMEKPMEPYLTEEVLACESANVSTSIYPTHGFAGNLLSISVWRSDMLYAYDEAAQKLLENRMATATHHAVFDLRTGEQLTLSDLFVDDTDLNALLNPLIANALAGTEGEVNWDIFRPYGGLIRPFRGLPADYPSFSVSDEHLTIHIPSGNPYIGTNYNIYLPLEQLQPHLAQPVMDSSPFVLDSVERYEVFRGTPCMRHTAENYDMLPLYGDEQLGFRPYLLTDSLGRPTVGRINSQLLEIYDELTAAEPPAYITDAKGDGDCYVYASSALLPTRAYTQFQISVYVGRIGQAPEYHTLARMYDMETGEPTPLADVLTDPDAALAALADMGLVIEDPANHYGWYCYGPNGEIYVCGGNDFSSVHPLPAGYFDSSVLK